MNKTSLKQCKEMINEINRNLNLNKIQNKSNDLIQLVLKDNNNKFYLNVEKYKDYPQKNIINKLGVFNLIELDKKLKTFFKKNK